jgi:hypothetical protein
LEDCTGQDIPMQTQFTIYAIIKQEFMKEGLSALEEELQKVTEGVHSNMAFRIRESDVSVSI